MDKAIGYGVAGHSVDGTDLEACLNVLDRAVSAARGGAGPQLVIASLLRLVGHGEHERRSYVDPKLRESSLGGDCLKLASNASCAKTGRTRKRCGKCRRISSARSRTPSAITLREPLPDPNTETGARWHTPSERRGL